MGCISGTEGVVEILTVSQTTHVIRGAPWVMIPFITDEGREQGSTGNCDARVDTNRRADAWGLWGRQGYTFG